MSDDITVLRHVSLDAVPVPMSLCIKQGAWDVLASSFPDLRTLASHLRYDGKVVRYLSPPAGRIERRDALPVRWIAFPRYDLDGDTCLRPLTKAEGLQRLVAECCALPGMLTRARVQRLVRWIDGVSCYDLQLSDVQAAVSQISRAIG
jgi:hypothetical protein